MAQKRKRYVTPAGKAKYSYLTKPDTKFNKDGEYSTTVYYSAEVAAPLLEQIDTAYDAGVEQIKAEQELKAKEKGEKAKKLKLADKPYVVDEETGEVKVKFKMRAKIKNKKDEVIELKPTIFDKTGTPYKTAPRIGNGTTLKVSFETAPFYIAKSGAGITLRLQGVQILELVEWGGGDASAFGFSNEGVDEEEPDLEEEEDDEETGDEDTSVGSDF